MKDVYVGAFTNQTFNKNKNESAILKTKNYNPPDIILQRLPLGERVKNTEVNRLRSGYIRVALTSVDFQENVKFGLKLETK